jgi:hypothetical protein
MTSDAPGTYARFGTIDVQRFTFNGEKLELLVDKVIKVNEVNREEESCP